MVPVPAVPPHHFVDLGPGPMLPGARLHVDIGPAPIALFALEGEILAVEDACLRCAEPLLTGPVFGYTLTCPHCGWSYDLRTGAARGVPAMRMHTFAVCSQGGHLYLEWQPG